MVLSIKTEKLTPDSIDCLKTSLHSLATHHNDVSEYFKGIYPTKPYHEILNAMKEKMLSGASIIEVVRKNNEVIAFSQYSITGDIGELEYLFTKDEHRGKGYGGFLLEQALNHFKNNNVRRIDISIIYGNDAAIRLYRKYGFLPRTEIYSMIQ